MPFLEMDYNDEITCFAIIMKYNNK